MEKKIQIKQPKYQVIAEDIAAKIVEKKYVVGEKIYARSSLASQYSVSSETARRAIAVLQDLNIVEATKGSGVVIVSYENAAKYIQRLTGVKSIRDLQKQLTDSIERQIDELHHFQDTLVEMVNRTSRYQSINPFVPFQIDITENCPFLSKNVGEINFWQETGATIIGIKKDHELIVSPGPYATLSAGDTLFFIGKEECYSNVKHFLQLESNNFQSE
ncbi:TrkA C-terminal domain-containing protein [Solibacillus sp. FSL W7-1436]|uniref:TrkA C-terminal domain-containing protein n=1 Tax=Solibacillus sp. FSL W7-1436 TaxID=2921705 RepID=UPI0030FA6F6C